MLFRRIISRFSRSALSGGSGVSLRRAAGQMVYKKYENLYAADIEHTDIKAEDLLNKLRASKLRLEASKDRKALLTECLDQLDLQLKIWRSTLSGAESEKATETYFAVKRIQPKAVPTLELWVDELLKSFGKKPMHFQEMILLFRIVLRTDITLTHAALWKFIDEQVQTQYHQLERAANVVSITLRTYLCRQHALGTTELPMTTKLRGTLERGLWRTFLNEIVTLIALCAHLKDDPAFVGRIALAAEKRLPLETDENILSSAAVRLSKITEGVTPEILSLLAKTRTRLLTLSKEKPLGILSLSKLLWWPRKSDRNDNPRSEQSELTEEEFDAYASQLAQHAEIVPNKLALTSLSFLFEALVNSRFTKAEQFNNLQKVIEKTLDEATALGDDVWQESSELRAIVGMLTKFITLDHTFRFPIRFRLIEKLHGHVLRRFEHFPPALIGELAITYRRLWTGQLFLFEKRKQIVGEDGIPVPSPKVLALAESFTKRLLAYITDRPTLRGQTIAEVLALVLITNTPKSSDLLSQYEERLMDPALWRGSALFRNLLPLIVAIANAPPKSVKETFQKRLLAKINDTLGPSSKARPSEVRDGFLALSFSVKMFPSEELLVPFGNYLHNGFVGMALELPIDDVLSYLRILANHKFPVLTDLVALEPRLKRALPTLSARELSAVVQSYVRRHAGLASFFEAVDEQLARMMARPNATEQAEHLITALYHFVGRQHPSPILSRNFESLLTSVLSKRTLTSKFTIYCLQVLTLTQSKATELLRQLLNRLEEQLMTENAEELGALDNRTPSVLDAFAGRSTIPDFLASILHGTFNQLAVFQPSIRLSDFPKLSEIQTKVAAANTTAMLEKRAVKESSALEEFVEKTLKEAGIPHEMNKVIDHLMVDVFIEPRLILEIDSEGYHKINSTDEDMQRFIDRKEYLSRRGFEVRTISGLELNEKTDLSALKATILGYVKKR